jgi:hypothetical protein
VVRGRHPTVFLAPAVVRLLRDLPRLADLRDLLAFAKAYIRLAKFFNDLIRRMTRLLHLERIVSGLRPDAILSFRLALI